MKKYSLVTETLAYVSSTDETNSDERNLVAGSQNVIIDQQRKVRVRNGNTRYGAANTNLTGCRSGVTWNNSTGGEIVLRQYDDELEIDLTTVDGTELNTFYRLINGLPTTGKARFTTWYSDSENVDLLIFVIGNANTYAWGGGVCIVDSITGTTITKTGTNTFAQSRFFTVANKVLVNVRTGTEYTYTGGESTTTLTGIADTTGIIAGDVLVQKVITNSNSPIANRNNHTVYTFENQLCVASDEDEQVYISKNTNYTDFSYSSPRLPGEGALLTLDDSAKAFGELEEKLIIFAGRSSIYQVNTQEITVGTTLTETLSVQKYQTGEGQSAQSQEVVAQINNTIVYLSFEPAVREILSPRELEGGGAPRTLSNPIRPDIEAETWENACAKWYKSAYYLSAPTNGHVYILEYREDADGKLRRFWQPLQTMFIGAFVTKNAKLYGHSSAVPETYRIMDPDAYSDISSDNEKLPYRAIAKFAYRNYGQRANLKNFDEYFVEGEISPSTVITNTLLYNYGGNAQTLVNYLRGDDTSIIEETLEQASLGQSPLGVNPLGGITNVPAGTAKFRGIIEIAKEEFFEMQEVFETDETDQYWSIISRGTNAGMSSRQPVNKKI